MLLLALAVLAAAPAVVSADSCSGLSKGAMVGIIVESVVIFVLIICLLAVLRQLQIARNKLKAARADYAQEHKRLADIEANIERPLSSMSFPGSPQDDRYEDSHVALLPPPALRPQSRSFSSPPSVRSSTLYDFTPQQENFGFDLKPYTPPIIAQPQPQPAPKHIAEISMATLPNPHSEHGHGTADDDDDDDDTDSTSHESSLVAPLPTSFKPSQVSEDSGSLKTPQPRSRAGSDSSWAANVVNALERGPTPMSRTATVSTTVSAYTDEASSPASGPVHELLLNRQRDSGSHSPQASSGIN